MGQMQGSESTGVWHVGMEMVGYKAYFCALSLHEHSRSQQSIKRRTHIIQGLHLQEDGYLDYTGWGETSPLQEPQYPEVGWVEVGRSRDGGLKTWSGRQGIKATYGTWRQQWAVFGEQDFTPSQAINGCHSNLARRKYQLRPIQRGR